VDARLHEKRAFRFSIATLLFLMLCLGGYLAGYRRGFDSGKQAASDATLFVKTYPVGDLIASRHPFAQQAADFDSLIDAIVTTVSPSDWMENGTGDGEIQPYPSNLSLVISQSQANHKKIVELLQRLRKTPSSVAANRPKLAP
jgi:hypothetical protein